MQRVAHNDDEVLRRMGTLRCSLAPAVRSAECLADLGSTTNGFGTYDNSESIREGSGVGAAR